MEIPGFDMSAMVEDLYGESIVDVVGPETFLSKPFTIKVSLSFLIFSLSLI